MQTQEVKALERAMEAMEAAKAEAKRTRAEFRKALYQHMGEVLGRNPAVIAGYPFERWQIAYWRYKEILKDRRKK